MQLQNDLGTHLKLYWWVDAQVIYVQWPAVSTLGAITQVSTRISSMVASTSNDVHILNDCRLMLNYPTHIPSVRQAMFFMSELHHGWLLSVTQPGYMNHLMNILPHMMGHGRARVFLTFSESLHFLRYIDNTLEFPQEPVA